MRHEPETAQVVLESALNLGRATPADLETVVQSLPTRRRRLLHPLAAAESGSETRVRLFLESQQFRVTTQTWLPGIGRVDLLVGRSLVLECDSEAHHGGRSQQSEDRRRDLAARDAGYDVIRLSYPQIWHDWSATQISLTRHLHTGRHLLPAKDPRVVNI